MREDSVTSDHGDLITVGDWEDSGELFVSIQEAGDDRASAGLFSPDQIQEIINHLDSRLRMLGGQI